VVFVPWTAPGDRARVRVVETRASYARGEVVELLAAGPARVAPQCAVFGSCGGCAWQHVDYATQCRAKAAILRDALVRIGRLSLPGSVEVRSSPSPWRYRARARVWVAGGRVGFRRRRSHALCATSSCPVLVPALEQTLEELAASPPRDGELELVAGDDGRVQVSRRGRAAAITRRGQGAALRLGSGDELLLSPGVFAQGNALLRDALATAVLEAAGHGQWAVELFAGAGFFTAGLARRFARVVAVEAHAPAVRDLHANLRRAGIVNVEVRAGTSEDFLSEWRGREHPPDAIVLDPPRTGLARGAAAALAALGAARITYLSCDPATLARDLAVLVASGYALQRVEGFDLFPQTAHVEALALLARQGGEV
jgi:23S rRNA (uracil1939-C5)-methyltransferase